MSKTFAPQRKADGKNFVFRKASMPSAKPLTWVHPLQDTGPLVKALVLKAPAGTTMLGVSQRAHFTEYCEIWARVMREPGLIDADAVCEVDETMTYDEVEAAVPAPFGREVRESNQYASEVGFDGGDPFVKRPAECGVDMGALNSLESFMRAEDWTDCLSNQAYNVVVGGLSRKGLLQPRRRGDSIAEALLCSFLGTSPSLPLPQLKKDLQRIPHNATIFTIPLPTHIPLDPSETPKLEFSSLNPSPNTKTSCTHKRPQSHAQLPQSPQLAQHGHSLPLTHPLQPLKHL